MSGRVLNSQWRNLSGARDGAACYNACAMQISLETVRALARLLEETDLAELTLESSAPIPAHSETEQTATNRSTTPASSHASSLQSTLEGVPHPAPAFRLTLQRAASKRNRRVADREASAAKAAEAAGSTVSSGVATPIGEVEVISTAVGVFRAREAPLKEGDEIKAGAIVGSVEALKVPTEIVCAASGRIQSVLVQEGQGVEYGQVLFLIEVTVS